MKYWLVVDDGMGGKMVEIDTPTTIQKGDFISTYGPSEPLKVTGVIHQFLKEGKYDGTRLLVEQATLAELGTETFSFP